MGHEVQVDNVTKMFGTTAGLRNASLSAGRGISVIIGPNGAGKSTLLRCIGGLYRPDSGTVRVFGRDPYYDDSVRKRASLLSDNYALYDRLTVKSNLLFFGRLYGNSDAETMDISKKVLGRLDAYGLMEKKAGELSRGTKQKVAICRALLGSPDAFLLDEPTAFLDAHTAEEVHLMLEELADLGSTILYATQRLGEAARFKASIFVIKKGRVSRKLEHADLYGSVLDGATVRIRLARAFSYALARKAPHFKEAEGLNVSILVHGYRDISESAGWLIRRGAYIVGIDYAEPLMEEMLGD